MIPDNTVDRYYYIFDSREQRALVMDRMTGREYAWEEAPQASLMEHVQQRKSEAPLRDFACWCAQQTDVAAAPLHTTTGQLWAAVRPNSAPASRARVRSSAMEAAVVAAAVGLPQHQKAAAQLLLVHACTHPDARQAALDAAHMHERWAEFAAEAAPKTAVQTIRQRHIDWLLDTLGGSERGRSHIL